MHDIRKLRDDAAALKASLLRKGFEADTEKALALDDKWRQLTRKADDLKAELNRASRAIGEAKKAGNSAKTEMEAARQIRENIAKTDDKKHLAKEELDTLLASWPAEPDETAPDGLSDKDNVVVIEANELPELSFEPQDHLTLSENLGILDMPRGAKVTGSGWPMYVGQGATLERALINFMIDTQTRENGYKELFVPFAVNPDSAYGTSQLPKMEDDMYYMEKDDMYLIPTAEVPITNYHRGETLLQSNLPLKYTAYSACFRREAGAYGAETRGLLRIHQFNKVELVQIVEPKNSSAAHKEILSNALSILEKLGITYRVIELCGGDLSFGAAKCFDIEVYSPATENWLEASSVSNFKDFQARRMNLRYKGGEKGGKPEYVHTLNGSGLATSRLMVSLMETYQTENGTIRVPEALQPYMGGLKEIVGDKA